MPSEYNVRVLATLRDRVSTGLQLMAGNLARTAERTALLQRRLAELGTTEAISRRRAALNAQTDQRIIGLLGQRHAKLLAVSNLESTAAQRATLNAQIRERGERASIRRASEQLRLTRQLNQQAVIRAQIEQQAALSSARAGMLRGGLMLGAGAVGLDLAVHGAKAAGQLQLREAVLRAVYGYSRGQTARIRTQAFGLSQTLGNLSAGDVEQLRLSLLGSGLSRRATGAVLPEVARVTDILNAVRGAPLQATAAQMGQIANLLGARSAARFRPIGESLLHAGLIAPGSMSELLTQSNYIAPLMRRGFNAQSIIRLAVLSQQLGGRGAMSPENIATFLARLQITKSTRGMALALGGRQLIAAQWLGLPEFIHKHPHFNLPQLQSLLMQDRKRLGTTKFLTDATMLWGLSGMRTAEQLSQPQIAQMLKTVAARMKAMGSSAQMNAKLLDTLPRQIKLLHTNMRSFGQALSAPLVRPLQDINHILAATAGRLTLMFAHHKGAAALWGGTGTTLSLFGAIGGGVSLLSSTLKYAAARGFLVNASKFAGGLDLISGALSRLFLPVMEIQAAWTLAHHVGRKAALANPLTGGYGGMPGWERNAAAWGRAHPWHATPTVVHHHHITNHNKFTVDSDARIKEIAKHLKSGAMTNTKSRGATFHPAAFGVPTE